MRDAASIILNSYEKFDMQIHNIITILLIKW